MTAWLPLFLLVIFGLSKDYHVLILSRICEFHDAGMSTDDAVAHGIRATAGVVTSAALVSAILLPATMKLLGDWNWYLPRWLEWLPRLGHQAPPTPEPAPTPEPRIPVHV